MLILTRKIGEIIRIGDNVTVRVLALRGGQVSLGFTAPGDVRIFREEVLRGEAPAPAISARPATTADGDAPCDLATRRPAKARQAASAARHVATRQS